MLIMKDGMGVVSHVTQYLPAFIFISYITIIQSAVTPIVKSPNGRKFVSDEEDGGFYKSILIDSSNLHAYVGARNNLYKIKLSDGKEAGSSHPQTITSDYPDFREAETEVESDYNPQSDVYQTIDRFINRRQPIQLIATEKLSQVYKLKNITYEQQCRRQIKILKLYYGKHLQLPVDDPDMVCSQHYKGLAWIDNSDGKLIALRNGIFGSMPVGLTGVSNFKKGWPVWLAESAALTVPGVNINTFAGLVNETRRVIYEANRTCYKCGYSQKFLDCLYNGPETIRNGMQDICYREYPIPNYMATNYLCDATPNPSRVIIESNNMEVVEENPLPDTNRESCEGMNLASTFLSGFHPNQITKTITSASGNGPGGGTAIYVLTEIGQEKQLDTNHEAFMGYEEPIPLTSSSSLALVRLIVEDGKDINYNSIVSSNPFKETWVTSPLTKYGRLVKTGNQATVPHRPRAVALFEDDDFVYFFFREVEWESLQHPEYSVNRHHFLWKSYDRTISYPWEHALPEEESGIKQFERSDPVFYMRHNTNTEPMFSEIKKIRNAHVYEPHLQAFKYTWDNSKLVSRVGRVCKNDVGLPIGVQDASVYNIDNKLSLSAFQTYLKSKITCSVKVKAVPRSWRLRKDIFSFIIEKLTQRRPDMCASRDCVGNFVCSENYTVSGAPNRGVFCERNLKGRDVSFRAFLDYTTRHFDYINPNGLFQKVISGYTQYHWAYKQDFDTYSSVSYEYTELKDIYKVGDVIYGVFSSPHSESVSPHSQLPVGSAICQFTMQDIRDAFSGPFKKRINNAWRPYDPNNEQDPITPSPYSCDPDPVNVEAENIDRMDIEFTDETLPLEKELQNFDMRDKSSRLNFFEKDVEGSRTMWNAVTSEPLFTSLDHQYEKIQVEAFVNDVTILYMATADGEIHKIVTWKKLDTRKCWSPNATDLENWWRTETNLHNNSWGQDYFTLTQESETSGAENFLFTSEWDCDQTTSYSHLAVYKPFGDSKYKIWDMKLAGDQLVIATDEAVVTIYTAQCDQYLHCSTCSADPHCGWNQQARSCQEFTAGLVQSVKSPADCSACLLKEKVFDPNEDVFLDTTLNLRQTESLNQFQWYHNGSLVNEKFGRFIFTKNNSLYIMNGRPEDAGSWELRDSADSTCMVTHQLKLSACVTEECQYEKKVLEWCTERDNWLEQMYDWQYAMEKSNCDITGDT